MNNDRQLQAEVRHALEAVTPPAPWLAARVAESLRARKGGVGMKVHAASRGGLSLAVVAVALLIAAALVVVLLASRAHVPAGSVPAGAGDQATAQYVALVEADDQLIRPSGPTCQGTNYESGCLEKIAKQDAGLRKFQADMERAQPPARLAGKHAQLRADLARLDSVRQEAQKAIDAKDYAAADAVVQTSMRDATNSVESDVNEILSIPR